jgi:cold shock CspA family protein
MKRKGIVQFYIKKRGFGYIRDINNREEFYVQSKYLLSPIQKGDLVEFEVKENNQGLYAVKVLLFK